MFTQIGQRIHEHMIRTSKPSMKLSRILLILIFILNGCTHQAPQSEGVVVDYDMYPIPHDSKKLGFKVAYTKLNENGHRIDHFEAHFTFESGESISQRAIGEITGDEYIVLASADIFGKFDYESNGFKVVINKDGKTVYSSTLLLDFKWN